jgi:molecular chaperone Hsp33
LIFTPFLGFKGAMSDDRKSRVHKYVAQDLSFRAAVANATLVVREMQGIQATYPVATMAVGRSMVAAALMAAQLKSGHQVSLYFRGDGPMEMFFAEAEFEGGVRGYCPHPQLQIHPKLGAVNLGLGIGNGLLTVVRTLPNQKHPQRGTVEIQTGEVGDDVAYYLFQSHQTRSVVSLGVKINAFGYVEAAGGIIIELMPGAPEGLIATLEKNFSAAPSLSETLAEGAGVEAIRDLYLKGFPTQELEHPYNLDYKCRCSKERLANALTLLGHLEVEKMIEEKLPADAKCEFCGRQYRLEIDELEELLAKLRAGQLH